MMSSLDDLPDDIRNAFGLRDAEFQPLPGDASSRRYARTSHPVHGPCLLLMDTPGTAHFLNYLRVAGHLRRLGFSAPKTFGVAQEDGYALIEDLGHGTYADLLASGADEVALYELATDTLAEFHNLPGAGHIDVPPYDMGRLLDEVALLPDWFAPGIGGPMPEEARSEHQRLWKAALTDVARVRRTLALRDFHVDNLMRLDDRKGVQACGLLDFQDALIGSPAYDVVSLLQDARRDLSPGLEQHCLDRYFLARPEMDRDAFLEHYHLLGAQRHAKVAGIFHRLNKRDGKPTYLPHVPRVLRLLERALDQAGLTEIARLYDRHIPTWRG